MYDTRRFGADGITVHPRPDERHIRYADVYELTKVLTTEFNIEGMTCAIGCAASIEKKLNKTPGVQSAKVDFENAIAQVVFDPTWIKDQELSTVIQEVGSAYKVTDNKRVDSFSILK